MKDFRDYGIFLPPGKTSGKAKCLCPKCGDRRHNKRDKSLSVDLDKRVWKCHHCGWTGALGHTDLEKQLWMERQPWFRPQEIRKQKPEYKRPVPKSASAPGEKVLKWFESRGITPGTVAECRISEGMEWMPQKNGEANTVQFNYFLDGEPVNTKFRTGDKCFKLCSGARLIPYNIDNIKGTPECIVTEGEMDALSFFECGRRDVISVPNGANANLTYLDDFIEEYFDDKETIYIAVDTDTKGIALRDELLRRFGAERCRVVDFGENCKDANEHLVAYGRESLLRCLADAPEFKLEGIFTVSDFEQSLDALFENGLQKGFTIGHEPLDNLISFETKRLCLVTGYPGSGKSEFIDEIAERLNIRYGWRWAYFSPENAPLAYHASKLIEKFTGAKFDRLHINDREYARVKQHLDNDFFFISPKDYRVDTILEKARYLVRRRGIKALVIDPYNRLEDEKNGMKETDYISTLLDKLTNFAQQNDILVILMAHPAKPARNREGEFDLPTLYDISGSAHFFNKADFGIIIHRHRLSNLVEIKIDKVKFRHLGQPGSVKMKYNINNGRYTPMPPNGVDGEPEWDNTNHLAEAQRRRVAEAVEAARLPLSDNYPDEPPASAGDLPVPTDDSWLPPPGVEAPF
ncbi:MAG: toprim domain-containing protein [Bacteroides sp.]|nr:toprim domain-containing protein [Bacteroides sp.]